MSVLSINIATMDNGSRNTSREFRDRDVLHNFISVYYYKQLPKLWDIRCNECSNRDKKNDAYK